MTTPQAKYPRAQSLMQTIIPDLERRCEAYRATSEPPDNDTREAFMNYLHEVLDELEAALATGDLAAAAGRAHSLKGMGGAVAAPEISVLGEELERAAQRGSRQDVRRLSDALHVWFRENGGR